MIPDKYRARVLAMMEDEYGPAETPDEEEMLLGTYMAASLAFEFAIEDLAEAVREWLEQVV